MNGVKRKVHFVGVGGIGMSGLAEILLNLGYEVSGSDLKSSEIIDRLIGYGLKFYEGHASANIGDAGIVVRSAAVSDDNVEIVTAKERGVPVIHRSDLLADLIRLKPNAVVVGGTHGKTTTTSMIASFLDHANIGATSIVGGILHRSGTNARWGTGDYLVAESDEHDGSFLRLHPTIAVVTSIDAEHLEYYGTLDRIKQAFIDFCNGVPFYGYSILCIDDPNIKSILSEIESVCITYGLDETASLRGVDIKIEMCEKFASVSELLRSIKTRFTVINQDERLGVVGRLGEVVIHSLGIHNIRNALGACAVGLCLGLKFGLISDGLRQFEGVQRRLQLCGERKGVVVIEDYAHHPTEIASTMEAVRWIKPKRLIVIFQPHLYSRTKFFADTFAEVLLKSDMAIVTDIYPSRESPIEGVDASLIVDSARRQGADHVYLIRDMYDVPNFLVKQLKGGDVVLILGAGNINKIAEPLLTYIDEGVNNA
ncbi:MAG TPA: UDP-N-acetylmuramate--L-alanine ligase [Candidatus Hydrogenedens sp.]|nr:UDP-N-acetylmuramate--L-alanine ligase [Candidatus Hydrogenedens sp.]HOL19424.1 UDP-N-acetylmuramate--L-alanine ligase [Candidatus Hydrogenedens sp.]HPP58253.1 UDP-N-acetylmuramate--L-alanine ligase [Candidatus Hydrogenedens sp.]